MRVELLFWEGCPSYANAHAQLRASLIEAGLDPDEVILREIETEADAESHQFVGSPTIRWCQASAYGQWLQVNTTTVAGAPSS